MTVTGNEQRVYGTLTGGCTIWLKRFKVTCGSTTLYGDAVPYKNCGYKYKGYISLLFFASGATLPYAVFEIRKCKSGKNYIFIETYGEVLSTVLPMSLWFNGGSETTPDWQLLNSCASGILPYIESTFKFNETKGGSVANTLECCKKCTSCDCLTCNVLDRFYVVNTATNWRIDGNDIIQHHQWNVLSVMPLNYGYNKYQDQSLLFNLTELPITYTYNKLISWNEFNVSIIIVDNQRIEFLIVDPDGGIVFNNSVTLETHYIDDLGIDNLLESYTIGKSYQSPNIGVEYKLNCDTIDITSYHMTQYNGVTIPTYKDITLIDAGNAGGNFVIVVFRKGSDNNIYTRIGDRQGSQYWCFGTNGYTSWALDVWAVENAEFCR